MENAAGIASMMLTTECLIADKKEDEKMPAMPPPEEWAAWAAECIEPIRQDYVRRMSGNKVSKNSVKRSKTKQAKKPPRERGLFDDKKRTKPFLSSIYLIFD